MLILCHLITWAMLMVNMLIKHVNLSSASIICQRYATLMYLLLWFPGTSKKSRPPGVEKDYMCNFWNFGQWASFMPRYCNFENWPVSWKPLSIEQKYATFQLLRVERVLTGIFNFWNFGHLKIGPYHGNRCPYSKNKLNFEPLRKKEYMCNFWNFGQWPTFMPKYGNFEQCWKWACISEAAAHKAKIRSISPPWGRNRVYVQLQELSCPKMASLKIDLYLRNRCP